MEMFDAFMHYAHNMKIREKDYSFNLQQNAAYQVFLAECTALTVGRGLYG